MEDFLSDALNWKEVLPGGLHITEYIQLCFLYGFKPTLSENAQRNIDYEIDAEYPEPEQGVDVTTLDQVWEANLDSPLPIDDADLPQRAASVFETEGMETIGDYVLTGSRSLMKRGLSQDAVRKMNAHLREHYGIDKSIIAACPTLREALGIKRLVSLASNASPITSPDKADR